MTDGPGLSRREQGKLERHEQLLGAARVLFAERGITATTVEDIVAAAGVARATFFNHFGSKPALAAALYSRRVEAFSAFVSRLLARDLSTGDRLRRLFSDVARDEQVEPGTLRAEIEVLDRDPAPAEVREDRTARVNAEILRVLQQGRDHGEVRSDYPVEFLAETVTAIYLGRVRQWKQDPDPGAHHDFTRAGAFAAEAVAPRSDTS